MKKIIFTFIVILFTLPLSYGSNIKLIFRYDDFYLKKDPINEQLVNLFIKNRIPIVLGVIPFDKEEKLMLDADYAFLPVLKKGVEQNLIEIAIHGFNHEKISTFGEFSATPYEEQFRRLNKSKNALDSIFSVNTVTFIPPWNAYDESALKVMEKLSLHYLSSSLSAGQDISSKNIDYLPFTIDHPYKLLPTLNAYKSRDGVIVLMFHRYDFDKKFNLSDINNILCKVNAIPNLEILTFSQLKDKQESANAKRFRLNYQRNLINKYGCSNNGMLQTTCYLNLINILNIILHFILFLIVYLSVNKLLHLKKASKNKILHGIYAATMTIPFIFITLANLLSPLKILLITLLAAISIPLILFWKKK